MTTGNTGVMSKEGYYPFDCVRSSRSGYHPTWVIMYRQDIPDGGKKLPTSSGPTCRYRLVPGYCLPQDVLNAMITKNQAIPVGSDMDDMLDVIDRRGGAGTSVSIDWYNFVVDEVAERVISRGLHKSKRDIIRDVLRYRAKEVFSRFSVPPDTVSDLLMDWEISINDKGYSQKSDFSSLLSQTLRFCGGSLNKFLKLEPVGDDLSPAIQR